MLLGTLKRTGGALPHVPCLIGQWVTVAILSKEDNETPDGNAEVRVLQPKLADVPEKARREKELWFWEVCMLRTRCHRIRFAKRAWLARIRFRLRRCLRLEEKRRGNHSQRTSSCTGCAHPGLSTVKKRSKNQRSKGFGRWRDNEHTAARQPECGGTRTWDGW